MSDYTLQFPKNLSINDHNKIWFWVRDNNTKYSYVYKNRLLNTGTSITFENKADYITFKLRWL